MSASIEVDDSLMQEAMRSSGAGSEQEAVEAALRLLVQMKAQIAILKLRGRVKWDGDLAATRKMRTFD